MFWLKILTKGIEKMSWIIAVVFIAIPHGEYLLYSVYYIVASVWLWNFLDGGTKEVKFLAYNQHTYCIVASRSTSRLVTCLGLFKLLMKGIFGPYVL